MGAGLGRQIVPFPGDHRPVTRREDADQTSPGSILRWQVFRSAA
jgi:hypothetical protein